MQETSWGAFGDTSAGAGQPAAKPPLKEQSDDWASLLDGPSTAAATPPALADPFAATPSAVAAPAQATDPFAARPSPAAAQQDPFAVLSSSASMLQCAHNDSQSSTLHLQYVLYAYSEVDDDHDSLPGC